MGTAGFPVQSLTRERLLRCLDGDPDSWTEFSRSMTPVLSGAIRGTLARLSIRETPGLVEELIQETWTAILRDSGRPLREFRWECPLEGFLSAVAAGCCVDWLRRRDRDWRTRDAATERALWEAVRPGDDASSPLENDERMRMLRDALERLPSRSRLALQWFYWENVPGESIARLLGIRPQSIWPLLAKAREQVRRKIGSIPGKKRKIG